MATPKRDGMKKATSFLKETSKQAKKNCFFRIGFKSDQD